MGLFKSSCTFNTLPHHCPTNTWSSLITHRAFCELYMSITVPSLRVSMRICCNVTILVKMFSYFLVLQMTQWQTRPFFTPAQCNGHSLDEFVLHCITLRWFLETLKVERATCTIMNLKQKYMCKSNECLDVIMFYHFLYMLHSQLIN